MGKLLELLISIHALREEGDKAGEPVTIPINDFYPRPPRGGRPVALPNEPGNRFISIHALREEGDVKGWLRATEVTRFLSTPSARRATARSALSAQVVRDFYPRPPRGGRRILPCFFPPKIIFLSTPSARRATHLTMLLSSENHISIHALREEGDPPEASPEADRVISIHALREEGDCSA